MRIMSLRPFHVACLAVLTSSAFAQKNNNGDALTNFLTTIGFSNVPYNQQSTVVVGDLIESSTNPYDGSIFHKPKPDFIKGAPSASSTYVPAGKIEKAATAGIELDLFGFKPSAEFKNYKDLSYTAMSATSVEIDPDEAQANLNKAGSMTDAFLRPDHVEVRKPKFGGAPRPYFDYTYYLVTKIYTVTASGDITSDSGTEIIATSGPIPACKFSTKAGETGSAGGTGTGGTETGGTGTGVTGTGGTGTGRTGTGTGTTGTGKGSGTAGTATGGASGTSTVDGVSGGVGTAITSAGKSALSSTAPSGGVHFCKKDGGTVHFDAAHPFPAMMDVVVLNLDPSNGYKTWRLVPRVVGFYPPKATSPGDRP